MVNTALLYSTTSAEDRREIMASLLFASVPVHGHLTPLLPLARALVERGDHVRFLTGARFRDVVAAAGAEHVPLPADADFDDRRIGDRFPGREGLSPVKAIAHDIEHVFVRPGASQFAAIQHLLEDEPADAIVVDPTFAAGALLVELPPAERPPVIVGGALPLNLPEPGLAPFGLGLPPRHGVSGAIRNHALHALTDRLFAPVNAAGREIGRRALGAEPRFPVMDWMRHADAIAQLAVESFEYPRPATDARVVFIGPASVSDARVHSRPEWWPDLDGARPVIHVTQGTLANDDLGDLVLPTIEAFADSDALVVVATGGVPVSSLGALPENVRVAEFLPYDELLPLTTVMISNGGYGGAQFALRHGVPLVVAPGQEDKIEVAARVAWSGAGVNLRRQRPAPAQLRRAVDRVLQDPSYRRAAERIGADIAAAPGASGFAALVDILIAERTLAGATG
ncbi:glycosyltransferase [Microbacterium sp. KUDC0406]|uniref:glycosyltransferase n=1 Tax=Microbacterium sp. KUDC0406 TaxID=2909588 RepID=UPI001F210CD7|nr:glycosyltransferase [Microbacterium sp. KUDC0406]UJP11338.1 glycosyltransferase [Microbacterium sp. KUDC0406]